MASVYSSSGVRDALRFGSGAARPSRPSSTISSSRSKARHTKGSCGCKPIAERHYSRIDVRAAGHHDTAQYRSPRPAATHRREIRMRHCAAGVTKTSASPARRDQRPLDAHPVCANASRWRPAHRQRTERMRRARRRPVASGAAAGSRTSCEKERREIGIVRQQTSHSASFQSEAMPGQFDRSRSGGKPAAHDRTSWSATSRR